MTQYFEIENDGGVEDAEVGFAIRPVSSDVPPAGIDLADKIHHTSEVIRNNLKNTKRENNIQSYDDRLRKIAKESLQDFFNPADGLSKLNRLQNSFANAEAPILNARLRGLAFWNVLILLICGAAIFVIHQFMSDPKRFDLESYKDSSRFFVAALYGVCGIHVSALFAEFLENQEITWASFERSQQSIFRMVRLTYVLGCILMLLLNYKVVILGIGSILLNDFISDPILGFVIGLLVGLARDRVIQLVLELFGKMAEPQPPNTSSKPGTK